MIIKESKWLKEEKLVITQISGQVDMAEIDTWNHSLQQALSMIEEIGKFKIFVNLHGFHAANFEAHKRFRTIIPATLAHYGWRVGYLDLFEAAADLPLTHIRGISCRAAVHVHQDEAKIEKYDSMFGKATERFFTDPIQGDSWIRGVVI